MGLLCVALCLSVFQLQHAALGSEGSEISVGMTLPDFRLSAPSSPEEKAYLGLKDTDSFSVPQVTSNLVVIVSLNVL